MVVVGRWSKEYLYSSCWQVEQRIHGQQLLVGGAKDTWIVVVDRLDSSCFQREQRIHGQKQLVGGAKDTCLVVVARCSKGYMDNSNWQVDGCDSSNCCLPSCGPGFKSQAQHLLFYDIKKVPLAYLFLILERTNKQNLFEKDVCALYSNKITIVQKLEYTACT